MSKLTLPLAVWLTVTYTSGRDRAQRWKDHFLDETGSADESVGKLIFLGISVALALGAVAIMVVVFRDAKGKIPPISPPTT